MTDVDGVSSRWHSNFSRNRSIFLSDSCSPPASFYPTSSSSSSSFFREDERKRERERGLALVGASSCKNTNKIWWGGGWSRAGAGWCTGMIKKVQTTAERHFARKRTTLAFMRAIMREHRLSVPCCRKRRPFSSPRSLFFSISRWRNKVGEEEGRERSGERKGSWSSFGTLYRCGIVFLFSFFFQARWKDMTLRRKREGEGTLHATRMNYFTRPLSLFPRWILVQSR